MKLILRGISLLFVLSSAWAQKVQTHSDPGVDFSHYKTYAWGERKLLTQQGPENRKLIDDSLVSAVSAQLKASGLSESQTTPDFYLSYQGGSFISKAAAGSAITPLEQAYPNLSGTWTSDTIPGSVPNVWVVMQGQIAFNITDAKSNKVVWSTTLSKKIRHPGQMPQNLDQQATKIAQKAFGNFPPKSRTK